MFNSYHLIHTIKKKNNVMYNTNFFNNTVASSKRNNKRTFDQDRCRDLLPQINYIEGALAALFTVLWTNFLLLLAGWWNSRVAAANYLHKRYLYLYPTCCNSKLFFCDAEAYQIFARDEARVHVHVIIKLKRRTLIERDDEEKFRWSSCDLNF